MLFSEVDIAKYSKEYQIKIFFSGSYNYFIFVTACYISYRPEFPCVILMISHMTTGSLYIFINIQYKKMLELKSGK